MMQGERALDNPAEAIEETGFLQGG